MKRFDLIGSNGVTRNFKKLWNQTLDVVDTLPAHAARLTADKDSHALVNVRVETHRDFPYLTAHFAYVRDVIDVCLIVYIVMLIV